MELVITNAIVNIKKEQTRVDNINNKAIKVVGGNFRKINLSRE